MSYDPPLFITVPVTSESQMQAVFKVLSGVSPATDVNQTRAVFKEPIDASPMLSDSKEMPDPKGSVAAAANSDIPKSSDSEEMPGAVSTASAGTGETVTTDASLSDLDIDGNPWTEALHASTKTKTAGGQWRMKIGVKRLAPNPASAAADTANNGETDPVPVSAAATIAADDEFAEFNTANAALENVAVKAVERIWADSDLSALCNQAAIAAGSSDKIKEIIDRYVSDQDTPHSRNIPAENREAFAVAIETHAGITYTG